MKDFHKWVSDMQGSIVDESHIGPPIQDMEEIQHVPYAKKEIVLPEYVGEWTPGRIKAYKKWLEENKNYYDYD